jgi:hypothetical protein
MASIKEGKNANIRTRVRSPPRPPDAGLPVLLNRLWELLPPSSRTRALQALGRMVAKQLQPTPSPTGVSREDD